MLLSSLNSTFRQLKQRVLAVDSISGAAWGWIAFIGLVLAGVWLDLIWELSAAARIASLIVAASVGVLLVARFLTGAFQRSGDVRLARRLDESGGTGGQIISGLELQMSSSSAAVSSLTYGLAQLAMMNAASLAERIPQTQAVPAKPVFRALTAATGLMLGLGLLSLLAPRLAGTEWVRFADPFGDHPPYSATTFLVEPGDTRVRYGSGLDIIVSTTGPQVEELELVLVANAAKDEKLPMFPQSSGRWMATVSSVTTPVQYYVRARTARSHRYKVEVITVPQLEDVRFRITPPAYTRDATYEGQLPQNGISALVGTTVEFRARSNRPLSGGTAELVSGDHHETVRLEPPTADGISHEVSGHWTVTRPGIFRLTVTDIKGEESHDSLTGTITLLNDHHPFVRLLEPPAQSLATPSAILPVVVGAEDDYGITRLQLFRSLNDSRAIPLELSVASPPSRRHEVRTVLPLPAYGLRPGDVIKLFARVEDNDPAGSKGAESTVAVIQIVADEDFQRMVRAREGLDVLMSKFQEAERRMEALQEEVEQLQKQLEKRDGEGELSDAEREQMEQLVKRIEEAAEAIRESAKLKLPYDLDEALSEQLEQLANEMQQAAEAGKEAAAERPSTAGQAARKLAELKKKLGAEKKKFEDQVTDPLELLAELYPLLEDQSRFVELYHRQRDLAERLASLKEQNNPDDPAMKVRMRDLETEQRKIREDLENLLNDIETHAARIPQDDPKLKALVESALEFVEAVRSSEASQQMSDAEMGLAEFSGQGGYTEAKHAADTLEQFLSRCEALGDGTGQACQNLKFQPKECLGDTLSQLLSDAGMKPGKFGKNGPEGSGGGYSARRSSLSNIGLYGNLPTRGNPTASQSRGQRASTGKGGTFRNAGDPAPASRLDPHGLLKASGASETTVPPRYRGKVEQYFKRIADETSGK